MKEMDTDTDGASGSWKAMGESADRDVLLPHAVLDNSDGNGSQHTGRRGNRGNIQDGSECASHIGDSRWETVAVVEPWRESSYQTWRVGNVRVVDVVQLPGALRPPICDQVLAWYSHPLNKRKNGLKQGGCSDDDDNDDVDDVGQIDFIALSTGCMSMMMMKGSFLLWGGVG